MCVLPCYHRCTDALLRCSGQACCPQMISNMLQHAAPPTLWPTLRSRASVWAARRVRMRSSGTPGLRASTGRLCGSRRRPLSRRGAPARQVSQASAAAPPTHSAALAAGPALPVAVMWCLALLGPGLMHCRHLATRHLSTPCALQRAPGRPAPCQMARSRGCTPLTLCCRNPSPPQQQQLQRLASRPRPSQKAQLWRRPRRRQPRRLATVLATLMVFEHLPCAPYSGSTQAVLQADAAGSQLSSPPHPPPRKPATQLTKPPAAISIESVASAPQCTPQSPSSSAAAATPVAA